MPLAWLAAAAWTKGFQGRSGRALRWRGRAAAGRRRSRTRRTSSSCSPTPAGSPEIGGLGVLQLDGGEVQTRLVFERSAIAALRTIGGLGTAAAAARDGLLMTRYRADGYGGAAGTAAALLGGRRAGNADGRGGAA